MDNRTIEEVRENETKLIDEMKKLEKENQKYKEVIENICSLLNDYEMQNDEIISSYCKEIRNAMKEVE